MVELRSFPKIFALGDRHITDIFSGPVEITEKVDGSQFVFGKINGEIRCRSKGTELYLDSPEKMFLDGIEYIQTIDVPNNILFFSEYLKKPKHNTLAYSQIPKNHLALFGAMTEGDGFISKHDVLSEYAKQIGIDVVPLVFSGIVNNPTDVFDMIETESFLGGQKVEGVVVKNYGKEFFVADRLYPIMCGKYVSEKFKEVHGKTWKKMNTGKGKWEVFCESYRTEARWEKAVQHLRDNGRIESTPRDIGSLIKEVHTDITEEEQENIKDFLWRQFGGELIRKSTAGLPEWYKQKLLIESIE